MDSPLTSREKAALIFFTKLMRNMILDEKLGVNFYIPISQADDNFRQAVERDSDINSRLHFRRYFSSYLHGQKTQCDEYVTVSLLEFFEGSESFDGMKALIAAYLDVNAQSIADESKNLGYDLPKRVWDVYGFYVARAKRELVSNARFIRQFVLQHPLYKQDSVVDGELVTDLLDTLFKIQQDNDCPALLGAYLQSFNCDEK